MLEYINQDNEIEMTKIDKKELLTSTAKLGSQTS